MAREKRVLSRKQVGIFFLVLSFGFVALAFTMNIYWLFLAVASLIVAVGRAA